MKYPSYNIPHNASFFDIVSLVDRVQAKVTSHLIDEKDIRNCHTWATDTWTNNSDQVFVEVFSGFTFSGYRFTSNCTYLYLHGSFGAVMAGCVKRMVAPERVYGTGARYIIRLQGVRGSMTVPPGFRMTGMEDNRNFVLESAPQRST